MEQKWSEHIASLYEDCYDRLCRVAYYQIGDLELAEEIVQDAFVLALSRKEKFLSHPNPEGWLAQTVHNLCQNERRRCSFSETSIEDLFLLVAPEPDMGLWELLPTQLPDKDKQILTWRFEEGRDYRKLADRLGLSETACRSRVSRAVEHCRKLLEKSEASL